MSVPLSFVQCEEPKNCSFWWLIQTIASFNCLSQNVWNWSIPFSKESDIFQGAILAHSVQTWRMHRWERLASEEESCWWGVKRGERQKMKRQHGTLFYIHFEKLIWLFTHCGSWQVVRFQKSKTLCSYEFTWHLLWTWSHLAATHSSPLRHTNSMDVPCVSVGRFSSTKYPASCFSVCTWCSHALCYISHTSMVL